MEEKTAKSSEEKPRKFMFNRLEFAGALGDLGTLIPLAAGLMMLNGLSPTSVLLWAGIFYVAAGLYFRLPMPVQPLKAVAALAIAAPDKINEPMIAAAGVLFGAIMLLLSLGGILARVERLFTRPVVRGIQVGLGLVLMKKALLLMVSDRFFLPGGPQGPPEALYWNLALGISAFLLVLLLLDNRKIPAALVALGIGLAAGILGGGLAGVKFEFGPSPIRFFAPGLHELASAFFLLLLPQLPLTIGNACIGTADTACQLFSQRPELGRVSASRLALTMGLVNLPAGFMAAMPMCHGAGGLAAHYRFGARTGGAPLMLGALFILAAILAGKSCLSLLMLIPGSVLGVLLLFAGLELCSLIRDLEERRELFVCFLVAGVGVASINMGWAFLAGIATDYLLRKTKKEI